MPGTERLASEGITFGALPIISKYWNGASEVDFPGVSRVDPGNSSEVAEAVLRALDSYPSELTSRGNCRFFRYILSMWRRARTTTGVVLASTRLHFVLSAASLEEEYQACLQTLAVLHLYPLASVDLRVRDVLWFKRHHYLFFSILKVHA